MQLSVIGIGRSDEEAIDEVAGREAGAHGVERFEISDEVRAQFCRENPELFVFDDFEGEIPGLGAILVENFAMRDMQTVRCEILLVIVHGL